MRSFALTLALLTVLLAKFALANELLETRNWTSSEGKTLRATLVRANSESVSLKVAKTGKKIDIPLARLSKADQQATAAWLQTNPDGLAAPAPPIPLARPLQRRTTAEGELPLLRREEEGARLPRQILQSSLRHQAQ